jgi:hypothetical protein
LRLYACPVRLIQSSARADTLKVASPRERIEGLFRWWDERRLAGDSRAGSWPRAQLQLRRKRFLRRAWFEVLIPLLTGVVVSPLVLLLPGWARGFALGVVLASGAWVSVLLVVTLSGIAPLYMGELAEQSTAQELRRLRPRGWRLGNHVLLSPNRYDIDHLAVGPGGALVVETKHSAGGWHDSFARERTEQAIESVRKKRDFVVPFLQPYVPRSTVRAVLVLAGDTLQTDPISTTDCGVTVVPMARLHEWLTSEVCDQGIGADTVASAWSKVMARVAQRDRQETAEAGPLARPLNDWLLFVAIVLLVTGAGYVAELETLRATGSAWFLPVGAVLGGLGYGAHRLGINSPWWQAWVVGTQIATVLFAVAYVATWVLRLTH